jgi:hypothetical protein
VSDLPALDALDRDGALREAVAGVEGVTRAGLLRSAFATAGLVAGGGAMLATTADAAGTQTRTTDLKILQFALVLEHLGVTFYTEALAKAGLAGETQRFAVRVLGHEKAHVAAVAQAIEGRGGTPGKPPRFDFGSATHSRGRFRGASAQLEELCVEALNGAAPSLTKPVLAAAAELVSVEARHVAWIRDINGSDPAPAPFDQAKSRTAARAALLATGYLKTTLHV